MNATPTTPNFETDDWDEGGKAHLKEMADRAKKLGRLMRASADFCERVDNCIGLCSMVLASASTVSTGSNLSHYSQTFAILSVVTGGTLVLLQSVQRYLDYTKHAQATRLSSHAFRNIAEDIEMQINYPPEKRAKYTIFYEQIHRKWDEAIDNRPLVAWYIQRHNTEQAEDLEVTTREFTQARAQTQAQWDK